MAQAPAPRIDAAETALIHALGCSTPYERRAVELSSGDVINTISAGNIGDPAIIIVHGWGSGVAFYGKNIDGICRARRVHFIDMLGFGASSRPPFPIDGPPEKAIDYFVSALIELAHILAEMENVTAFHVVGHSLGAYLTVQMVKREPALVRSLTLASPVGVPPATNANPVQGVIWRSIRWVIFRLWELRVTPQWIIRRVGPCIGRMLSRRLMRPRFAGDSSLQEKVSEYFYQISASEPAGEYALHTILKPGAWAHRPLFDTLPTVQCPTAFLYGDRDWMDSRVAERIIPNMKQARLMMIENAGHHVYYDNPLQFNKIVLEMSAF